MFELLRVKSLGFPGNLERVPRENCYPMLQWHSLVWIVIDHY